ncbi:MAG: hypothetical protein ACLS43_07110 [Evtepia gabavorous]
MENTERTYHFKKTLEKKERFVGGHRLCAGCGAGIAVRGVLRALREEDRAVVGNATGCLEVSSFLYPYTAYEDSYIHTALRAPAPPCPGGGGL